MNAQEFFLAARNGGATWSYGSPGVGTVGHIGMELLKTKTNMDPLHVPYPGNPLVIQALITDQIQLALLPPGLAAPQVKAGKLPGGVIPLAGAAAASYSSSASSPGKSTSVKPNWVKSRTRIGYSLPTRWSHSCCTTRAWKPSASRSMRRPSASKPV